MSEWLQSITRNLNEPSLLEFGFTVSYVQNENFSNLLHQDLDSSCTKWERYSAQVGMHELAPNRPGLYMFVWAPPSLALKTDTASLSFRIPIYIGKAEGSLQERLRSEYNAILREASPDSFWINSPGENRKTRLLRYFSLKPLEYWCCISSNPDLLPNLESRLVRLFNPPGNKQRKLRAIAPSEKIWRT